VTMLARELRPGTKKGGGSGRSPVVATRNTGTVTMVSLGADRESIQGKPTRTRASARVLVARGVGVVGRLTFVGESAKVCQTNVVVRSTLHILSSEPPLDQTCDARRRDLYEKRD
jgi:hypothetical protein